MADALRKSKTIVIGKTKYRLTQLGALEGRKLWLKFLHLLVKPVKEIAKAGELNELAMVAALGGLVENLTEEQTEELYTAFGQTTQIQQGEKWPTLGDELFDVHFAGKYHEMAQWLGQCVVFNFADFLGDIDLGKSIAQFTAAASKRMSPKDSTGSYGESSRTSADPT